jgi:hypothetical protein
MLVSWNLTSRRARLSRADVIVVSPAKAGRTWLRVLLNKYLSLHYGMPFAVGDLSERNPVVPSVVYTHWLWAHFGVPLWHSWQAVSKRLRGRYVIPPGILVRKKVILLIRDPRDVIVSAHFHATRRGSAETRKRVPASLADFIRSPHYGIGKAIWIMNLVHRRLSNHPRRLIVRYESLRADTFAELERILRFIGIAQPDHDQLRTAVEFADFENMRRMEQDKTVGARMLRPGDSSDPDSFKVRKGKVGGYADHLDPFDLAYVEEKIADLHPEYGYTKVTPGQ